MYTIEDVEFVVEINFALLLRYAQAATYSNYL